MPAPLPPAATVPPLTEAIARRLDAGCAAWNVAGMRGAQAAVAEVVGAELADFGPVAAFRSWALPGVEYYNRAYVTGPGAEEHLAAVSAFFREAGAIGRVEVSPADATPEVVGRLHEQGFRFARTYPVFYGSPLAAELPALPAGVEVRESPPEEIGRWIKVWFEGFAVPDEVWPEVSRVRAAWFSIPGYRRYAATVDGEIVGVAGLFVHGDIAMLEPAAVLERAQGARIHTAFIRRRLADAHAAGCDLVFVETGFATTSYRNQQRQGLQLAFNRLVFVDAGGD